jgi:hypothetical protein
VRAVFSGHDHIYERLEPQSGIYYFVSGAAGQLRFENLRKSSLTAAAFARDRHFVMIEVGSDKLYFQAVSRDGKTIDSGVLPRGAQKPTQ